MRFCFSFALLFFVLAGCSRSGKSSPIAGSWMVTEPLPAVMAFSKDGKYQIQLVGGTEMSEGSYTLNGDQIVIHPNNKASLEMTYKMALSKDTLMLTPVQLNGDKVGPASLVSIAFRMSRLDASERITPEAVAKVEAVFDKAYAGIPSSSSNDSADCATHVKQLAMAMAMYTEDYDGYITTGTWQENLEPYVKNRDMFDCPALVINGQRNGYALNEDIVGMSTAKLSDPSKTPAIFDSNVTATDDIASIGALPSPPRHKAGNTIGYLDGHVSSVP